MATRWDTSPANRKIFMLLVFSNKMLRTVQTGLSRPQETASHTSCVTARNEKSHKAQQNSQDSCCVFVPFTSKEAEKQTEKRCSVSETRLSLREKSCFRGGDVADSTEQQEPASSSPGSRMCYTFRFSFSKVKVTFSPNPFFC